MGHKLFVVHSWASQVDKVDTKSRMPESCEVLEFGAARVSCTTKGGVCWDPVQHLRCRTRKSGLVFFLTHHVCSHIVVLSTSCEDWLAGRDARSVGALTVMVLSITESHTLAMSGAEMCHAMHRGI